MSIKPMPSHSTTTSAFSTPELNITTPSNEAKPSQQRLESSHPPGHPHRQCPLVLLSHDSGTAAHETKPRPHLREDVGVFYLIEWVCWTSEQR